MNEQTTEVSDERDDAAITLFDLLEVIAQNLRLLIVGPLVVGLVALGVSFLITPTFTATTTILPPLPQQSSAAALMQALFAANVAPWMFGSLVVFLLIGFPVAFSLGLATLPILVIEPRLSPTVLFNEMFKAYNSFILLAVPFFLLTANLMSVGGITDRLVRLSRALVGHFPGGLAQVNVVLSIFFAGVSGSATADAASQSKIFIDAQTREGYDLSFSVAITAVSAVLAVVIPPSILMIVCCVCGSCSTSTFCCALLLRLPVCWALARQARAASS